MIDLERFAEDAGSNGRRNKVLGILGSTGDVAVSACGLRRDVLCCGALEHCIVTSSQ